MLQMRNLKLGELRDLPKQHIAAALDHQGSPLGIFVASPTGFPVPLFSDVSLFPLLLLPYPFPIPTLSFHS